MCVCLCVCVCVSPPQYYLEQLELLVERYGVLLVVGATSTCIPLPFVMDLQVCDGTHTHIHTHTQCSHTCTRSPTVYTCSQWSLYYVNEQSASDVCMAGLHRDLIH